MSETDKNLFRLDGKNALITGAAGNLGPVWAQALKEVGARVVLVDLPGKKMPSSYKSYEADLTVLKDLKHLHQGITNEIGLISILVNNAGIDVPPGVVFSDLHKIWEVNVEALVNCINEFLPDMKKAGTGSVINIGSLYLERAPDEKLYSHMGFDKPWAYGATKAAVHSITRHFAARLAKFGIRVNTLSPGGVFNNQDKEFVKKYSQKVPLGRMADKTKDLRGPLVFLASEAASYITGINLQVNGGYTAW